MSKPSTLRKKVRKLQNQSARHEADMHTCNREIEDLQLACAHENKEPPRFVMDWLATWYCPDCDVNDKALEKIQEKRKRLEEMERDIKRKD